MTQLLATQRQALILERLRTNGAVRVSELTEELAVSEMTVRRDIDQLAARGQCRKVHGGACLTMSTSEEPGFAAKSGANVAAKQAIGRAGAALVQPGQSVGISAGTTTYWVAVELAARLATDQITVVTNSLPAAEALAAPQPTTAGAAGPQVILTGGVRTPSQALVGPIADGGIGQLRLDWFFLGVHGMDPEAGLTTPNLAEAATNRAFMNSAAATVVTADASKWGTAALAQIAPLAAITALVTDQPPPAKAAKTIKRHHIDLRIARQP
ncbi:MAG: DeoR/GlpR family DNA-binding transcription regulator [Bifidobacteriaceae bacterium]|nr:DeoR/GlpR family DNA-binding transcription regulator [Bifidobacteriaceae bacterium]